MAACNQNAGLVPYVDYVLRRRIVEQNHKVRRRVVEEHPAVQSVAEILNASDRDNLNASCGTTFAEVVPKEELVVTTLDQEVNTSEP